jgi:hypothetical protein
MSATTYRTFSTLLSIGKTFHLVFWIH